ncbi:MAG: hypothetical protein H0V04_00420 [Chloroflexi bacterium]|nr:hypothetical protein [Chloroflexota bacterium]HEV8053232.1 hypothetical protein [Candidatus Limnocylindrales bacterium]
MDMLIIAHAALAVALLVMGAVNIALPKRRAGAHGRVGRAYLVLLVAALGSGMVIGARDPAISVFEIVTPPTLILGISGYVAARYRRAWLGRPWVFWHIQGQGGAYIGVVTATLFQTVPRVVPSSPLLLILLGVLPSIVGTILIVVAIRRWTRRRGASTMVTGR